MGAHVHKALIERGRAIGGKAKIAFFAQAVVETRQLWQGSAARAGEGRGALVLLAEMVGEFFGELDFGDFVAAERVAHAPAGGGVIDRAHVFKGGGGLGRKVRGDERAPGGGEFVVRVDAHDAEGEGDGAEVRGGHES